MYYSKTSIIRHPVIRQFLLAGMVASSGVCGCDVGGNAHAFHITGCVLIKITFFF